MTAKHKKLATDIHDDIRAQFDKIAKLAPDIEDWQHRYNQANAESLRDRTPVTYVTEDHHVAAARAILNATKAMGIAVRSLNRYAAEVIQDRETHDYVAREKFFGPEGNE